MSTATDRSKTITVGEGVVFSRFDYNQFIGFKHKDQRGRLWQVFRHRQSQPGGRVWLASVSERGGGDLMLNITERSKVYPLQDVEDSARPLCEAMLPLIESAEFPVPLGIGDAEMMVALQKMLDGMNEFDRAFEMAEAAENYEHRAVAVNIKNSLYPYQSSCRLLLDDVKQRRRATRRG